MKYQRLLILLLLFLFIFTFATPIFANVAVQPITGLTNAQQVFTATITSDKDISVVGVKVLIPSTIIQVNPFVKQGWTINTITSGTTVTEIDWTGGEIPTGQADTFAFYARLPSQTTMLTWKIYLTYADGSVVGWDQDPRALGKNQQGTPFSLTKVIEPTLSPYASRTDEEHTAQKANVGFVMSVVGIVIASVALSIARRKNPLVFTGNKPKHTNKRNHV